MLSAILRMSNPIKRFCSNQFFNERLNKEIDNEFFCLRDTDARELYETKKYCIGTRYPSLSVNCFSLKNKKIIALGCKK